MSREISRKKEIGRYFHCSLCIDEKPADQSPQDWARLSIGFTPIGLQVWCNRHDCNVCHIDFEGQKHPANTNRQTEETKH